MIKKYKKCLIYTLISIIAIVLPFTFLGNLIGLVALPLQYLFIIIVIPLLYVLVATLAKKIYIKRYGNWI